MSKEPGKPWNPKVNGPLAAIIIIACGLGATAFVMWNPESRPAQRASEHRAIPPMSSANSEAELSPDPAQGNGAEPSATDSELAAATQITLESLGIHVETTKIADGREKGGERVLIVTFKTDHPRQPAMFGELVQVLEAAYGLNETLDGDVDSTIAIVGDRNGKLISTVTATAADAGLMARKEITPAEYLNRWTWGPGWKRQ